MRCKTSPFGCKASKLSEREMRICPERGYMFACVCVGGGLGNTYERAKEQNRNETHTYREIKIKVVCASKQHWGLNTTWSLFSVLKTAALIGLLSITIHCIYSVFYTYMCLSSCSFPFPHFAIWVNIWRIIYYLSDTSFIYRVEIIWYIFQFCYGWSTFYHSLQGMSQTSVAELERAVTKTPILRHADKCTYA